LQARGDGRSKNRAPQLWPAGPERARDEKNDRNESPKKGISFLSFPVAKSFQTFQTFREAFAKTHRIASKSRLDIPARLLYTKHRKGAAGQTVVPLVWLEK